MRPIIMAAPAPPIMMRRPFRPVELRLQRLEVHVLLRPRADGRLGVRDEGVEGEICGPTPQVGVRVEARRRVEVRLGDEAWGEGWDAEVVVAVCLREGALAGGVGGAEVGVEGGVVVEEMGWGVWIGGLHGGWVEMRVKNQGSFAIQAARSGKETKKGKHGKLCRYTARNSKGRNDRRRSPE